jgi:hypothetical protein
VESGREGGAGQGSDPEAPQLGSGGGATIGTTSASSVATFGGFGIIEREIYQEMVVSWSLKVKESGVGVTCLGHADGFEVLYDICIVLGRAAMEGGKGEGGMGEGGIPGVRLHW